MWYDKVMSDLKRLKDKRSELQRLLDSLSTPARNSIYSTVEHIELDIREEYAETFETAALHDLLSDEEYLWLMSEIEKPASELDKTDRVFLARISFELATMADRSLAEMPTPSNYLH